MLYYPSDRRCSPLEANSDFDCGEETSEPSPSLGDYGGGYIQLVMYNPGVRMALRIDAVCAGVARFSVGSPFTRLDSPMWSLVPPSEPDPRRDGDRHIRSIFGGVRRAGVGEFRF